MPWRALIGRIAFLLLVLPAALFPGAAGAELLDELTVFQERTDAVVRITFSARIQYLRNAIVGDNLLEIYFQLLTADSSTVTETRRIAPSATFPGVEVTYPLQQRGQPQKLTVRFSRTVTLHVRPGGNRAIDLVIPDGARLLLRAPVEPVRESRSRFMIRLDSFGTLEDMRNAPPVPGEFSSFEVFTSEARRDGRTEYDILLGYFGTAETAERVHQRLRQRFPRAEIIDLGELPPEPAQIAVSPAAPKPAPAPAAAIPAAPPVAPPAPVAAIPPAPPVAPPAPIAAIPPTVAAPAPTPAPPPTPPAVTLPLPPPVSTAEVEARAAELMADASAALDSGHNAIAIERLNQLLMLPPNRQSQQAQELIGLARERGGETAKARAEYELYLRLFPDGEGAARVRAHLAALGAPAARAAPRPDRAPVRAVTGTLSQYYYGGRTKVDTVFNTPTTPDRSSFTAIDQSSLVTNLDLTLRNRSESSDSRLVLRDTNSWSFLDTTPSYNRLNAAYYDYRGLQSSFAARVGRQTGLSGGLPSRFDGAIAGLGIAEKWRVNAAAGAPVEYPAIDSKRRFWATNLEFENLGDAWSGNFFYIDQSVDGVPDRRAVGNEMRYFRDGTSLFSLLDYDTGYGEWNITMLQGTWQTRRAHDPEPALRPPQGAPAHHHQRDLRAADDLDLDPAPVAHPRASAPAGGRRDRDGDAGADRIHHAARREMAGRRGRAFDEHRPAACGRGERHPDTRTTRNREHLQLQRSGHRHEPVLEPRYERLQRHLRQRTHAKWLSARVQQSIARRCALDGRAVAPLLHAEGHVRT